MRARGWVPVMRHPSKCTCYIRFICGQGRKEQTGGEERKHSLISPVNSSGTIHRICVRLCLVNVHSPNYGKLRLIKSWIKGCTVVLLL